MLVDLRDRFGHRSDEAASPAVFSVEVAVEVAALGPFGFSHAVELREEVGGAGVPGLLAGPPGTNDRHRLPRSVAAEHLAVMRLEAVQGQGDDNRLRRPPFGIAV